MAAGVNLNDTSTSAKYIAVSSAGVELRNVGIKLYNSGNPTVDIVATGDVKFGLDTASEGTTTFRHEMPAGHVRLGPYVAGKPNVVWDNTNGALRFRQYQTDIIRFDSGGSYFAGPMSIGASGGIYQGTGSFASPTTGLKIWNDGGVGRLATYSGGTAQVYFDTTGSLFAGTGKAKLNSDGVTLEAWVLSTVGRLNLHDNPVSMKFVTSGGTKIANISGQVYSTSKSLSMNLGTSTFPRILLSDDVIELAPLTTATLNLGYSGAPPSEIRIYGDIVQYSGTASLDFTGKFIAAGVIDASGTLTGNEIISDTYLKANGGITVGVNVSGTPAEATILIDGRASAPSSPIGSEVALYVLLSGSTYTLYMKKPDGSTVALGSV